MLPVDRLSLPGRASQRQALDRPAITQEIENAGRSRLNAVGAWTIQAVVHPVRAVAERPDIDKKEILAADERRKRRCSVTDLGVVPN